MRSLPPLGSIQAFIQVARLGSMREAAEALALSSPALTRRIQALEQFVGTSLFDRQRGGLQLTLDGREFLEATSPHLEALAAAVEGVSRKATDMRLRIAVPSLFASQRLMPALPSLHRRYPELQIDVDTGNDRLARLNNGVDAAIVITDRIEGDLYSRLVEKGRLVAIGPKHPRVGQPAIKTAADLADHPVLVHRAMPNAFSEWCSRTGAPTIKPRAINRYDAGQLLLDAAAEGLGIAFMLESHLVHAGAGRLAQVLPQTVDSPYSYWFACEPAALKKRAVRVFHDWLFEQFEAH